MGLTVVKVTPALTEVIGVSGCFAFFGFCVLSSVTFGYFFMPETKGLSLLELENLYKPEQDKKHSEPQAVDEDLENYLKIRRESHRHSITSM